MKNLFLLVLLLILYSCLPSTDKKKAKDTNGKITTLGNISAVNCAVDEFYFSINNNTIVENLVPYGCTLGLRLKGIAGFKIKDGRVFCNASIKVLDSTNVEIITLEDVFTKTYPDGMKEETFTDIIE